MVFWIVFPVAEAHLLAAQSLHVKINAVMNDSG